MVPPAAPSFVVAKATPSFIVKSVLCPEAVVDAMWVKQKELAVARPAQAFLLVSELSEEEEEMARWLVHQRLTVLAKAVGAVPVPPTWPLLVAAPPA